MFSFTIFKNTFDNKTHRTMEFEDWVSFKAFLFNLSKKEGQKGGTNSSPLISPALYFKDSTRSNRNVSSWGSWCAVDVDDFDTNASELKENLHNYCGQYEYVCYSTASSKPEYPKFRLVFPLKSTVERSKIPHFWFALNKQLGSIGDKQTKDLSRMYYIPAKYPNAFNFFFENAGEIMNAENIMDLWEYKETTGTNSFLDKLPEALREQVINYRKEQLENKSIYWTSYRDCPFFPRKLGQEYMTISSTGWYHKMFQIMVAIAGNAIKSEYPITVKEIADLCREFDKDTGNWYNNRPFELEANSALEYIYRS